VHRLQQPHQLVGVETFSSPRRRRRCPSCCRRSLGPGQPKALHARGNPVHAEAIDQAVGRRMSLSVTISTA